MGSSNSKSEKPSAKNTRSKAEKSEITSSDKVRLQMKLQRDNLQAAICKYERVARIEHEKAKDLLLAGNKRKALYCLKREKAQEAQIATVTDMLNNVQHLIDTVEFAQIEGEVVAAMRDGKSELDNLNKMLNVDDIEKLMDETSESIEEANQINALLSQPLACVPDDEELLRELEGALGTATTKKLPDVKVPHHPLPETKKPAAKEEEEESDEEEAPARQYA
jgi:charged multivesicular body protein 6